MKSTAAIIQVGDKFLLTKRSATLSEEPGKWENIGGSVDSGETFEAAIIREAMEEIGVKLEITEIALEYKNDNDEIRCTVFYAATKDTPQLMEPDACTDIKWFTKSELKSADLADYTRGDFVRLKFID